MEYDDNLIKSLQIAKVCIEFAPVSIFKLDVDGNILEVNKKACQDLGYSKDELTRITLFDIDMELTREHWNSYVLTKKVNTPTLLESTHRRKDGSTFPVEVAPTYFNFDGQYYSYSFVNDISKRKEAEMEAMQNYDRYRALAEASFEGIVMTHQGVILEMNDQFCDMYGYSRHELINQPIDKLLAPEDRERVLGYVRNNRTAPYTHVAIRKDGIRFFVEINIRIITLDNKMVRVASIRDITEKINTENNLKKITLQEKEALRIAHMGHWEYNVNSNIFNLNDQFYALYGTNSKEHGGYEITVDDFARKFIHPDDSYLIKDAIENAIKTNDANFRYQTETRFIKADGSLRYQIIWFKIENDVFRKTRILSGVCQDITELKQAEQEIYRLNSELEERVRRRTAQLEIANKEMESFSYSISHDLRAPLRTLNSLSHILKEEYNEVLDQTGIGYLDRIASASLHMSKLIDGLLRISRITRTEMFYETVNLSELITKIADDLQSSEPERVVQWKITPGITAEADTTLIQIALTNLLSNAWKFSQNKNKTVIKFGLELQNKQRVFYIRDNGAGFDMTYADKLFHEFERLHSEKEFEGTGIGLVIVQRIIRRHGGKIWAKGEVGKGATFYFTLGTP